MLSAVDGGLKHELDLRVRCINGVVVIAVRGAVDAFTAPQLGEAINTSLEKPPAALVVDLSELEFLACAGMTVLLEGQQISSRLKKRFGVVAGGPRTSRPMELIGLDQLLSMYPTLEAALSSTWLGRRRIDMSLGLISPMLATLGRPPERFSDFAVEAKYDGVPPFTAVGYQVSARTDTPLAPSCSGRTAAMACCASAGLLAPDSPPITAARWRSSSCLFSANHHRSL
jgi:anti-sigma B factor antagonist